MTSTPDWSALEHAQGPATEVPDRIEELVGEDPTLMEDAFAALHEALVGRGTWFAAAAPAVALLLDALPGAAEPGLVLVLVAEILGADHVRGWLAPLEDLPAGSTEAHQAALQRKQTLFEAVASDSANARAAALLVLAMMPSLAQEGRACAARRAVEDGDEVVRASALLALGRLGAGDDAARAIVIDACGAASSVVQGAATLAWLRLDPRRSLEEAAAGIEAWLSWRVPTVWAEGQTELPWFGGPCVGFYAMTQPLNATSRGLVDLARHRRDTETLADLSLRLGRESSSGTVAACAGPILLDLLGFREQHADKNGIPHVALVEELSPAQRAFAARLADTTLLPAAGSGLPACGECRKRWIGTLPPGPLERQVELELEGSRIARPFWRARNELEARRIFGVPLPPPLDGMLAGRDRWHALVELSARSYGGMEMRALAPEVLEREIGAVPHDEELFSLAGRLADDLASRFVAAARTGTKMLPGFSMSALLLLPFVRAGRPIEPRWDALVHVGAQPQAREILASLPPERREGIVWDHVREAGPQAVPGLQEALAVLDLAPSQRIGENLVRRLAHPDVRGFFREKADAYLERVRDLAKSEPGLREALASAR